MCQWSPIVFLVSPVLTQLTRTIYVQGSSGSHSLSAMTTCEHLLNAFNREVKSYLYPGRKLFGPFFKVFRERLHLASL